MKKLNLKKLEGNIVEVTWKDIKSELGVDKKGLQDERVCDFFVICFSYGILYKVDEDGIILITEDSDVEVDYTAIPYHNIVDVRELVDVDVNKLMIELKGSKK